MRADIKAQQQPRRGDGTVERHEVETLVGRTGHIGQVICEAKAYLAPMYTIQEAKLKVTTRGGHTLRVKPRRVAVLG